MRTISLITLFVFTTTFLFAGDNLDETMKKLEAIKKEISQKKKSVRKAERKERSILAIIDSINEEIDNLEREEGELRRAHEETKNRILEIQSELESIEKELLIEKERVSRRLVALFKAQQWGYLPVLLKVDNLSNLLIHYKFLNILIGYDKGLIDGLKQNYERKKQNLEKLSRLESVLKQQAENLENRKRELLLKKNEKNVILAKIREEKLLYHSAIRELEESTRKLEDMLKEFSGTSEESDTEFVSRMGMLRMPVNGVIVKSFGKEVDPRFHTVIYRKGIVIKAEDNSEVRAIFGGSVAFAGSFSGYGKLIIIKHGENYYSVYARLSDIYKKEGEKVKEGEMIGRVGTSGLFKEQGLYFELRKGGKPLDPELWFSKN